MNEPDFSHNFSEWLRLRIERCDLTASALAREVGVETSTITRFVNRQRSVSSKVIDRLLPVLDRATSAKLADACRTMEALTRQLADVEARIKAVERGEAGVVVGYDPGEIAENLENALKLLRATGKTGIAESNG